LGESVQIFPRKGRGSAVHAVSKKIDTERGENGSGVWEVASFLGRKIAKVEGGKDGGVPKLPMDDVWVSWTPGKKNREDGM